MTIQKRGIVFFCVVLLNSKHLFDQFYNYLNYYTVFLFLLTSLVFKKHLIIDSINENINVQHIP